MSRHGPYRSAPHPSVHRNPWTQGHVYCSDSRSTQSSGSSHTYHVLGQGPRQGGVPDNPTFYHEPQPPPPPQPPHREGGVGYRDGYGRGMVVGRHGAQEGLLGQESGKYLIARPPAPRPQLLPTAPPQTQIPVQTEVVLDNGRRSRPVSSRAVTPVSGGADPAVTIVPCGGHCVALENFCHYFLQVAFLGGILTGMCLVIAGRVLRRDLEVLTYIGSLTGMVSGVLLWVQCMVRRGGRRLRVAQPQPPPPPPRHHHHHHQHQHHHHQPRHHPVPLPETIPLQHLPPPILRTVELEFREESGIPWWRRENMIT